MLDKLRNIKKKVGGESKISDENNPKEDGTTIVPTNNDRVLEPDEALWVAVIACDYDWKLLGVYFDGINWRKREPTMGSTVSEEFQGTCPVNYTDT